MQDFVDFEIFRKLTFHLKGDFLCIANSDIPWSSILVKLRLLSSGFINDSDLDPIGALKSEVTLNYGCRDFGKTCMFPFLRPCCRENRSKKCCVLVSTTII